ncbi:MAG: hypothetical protein A2632_01500 [Candidatus Pacebacteria bacterium RIFCSPHIGHO2_01_FULL_46_16]|nr:MAG: hypothetical protein A2632_01500 [Candidatus Pacebacteria bacterium RIFCSPHIGHO2_01_FULL_46_16]OGJ37724.1 MAG: hypothetical protein A3A82_00910 [Candidatus Pacebacteria bacterium RIFCSPLOWO2_01_FULL_47_12]
MKAVTQQENPAALSISLAHIALRATGLALLMVLGSALMLTFIVGYFGYRYLHQISAASNRTPSELILLAKSAISVAPREKNPTFLILGTDTLANRGDIPPLTDTMLLASLNLKTGVTHLLPLPRDIWHEAYKTKINALYAYGLERYPSEPARFPREVLQEMTGVPIEYTIVLDMAILSNLVDTLGGVSVSVPTSFVDNLFPNPGVDITNERDPKKLYKTVTFTKGTEIMSGERFLEFIRSRHSDSVEGTDLARSQRQQVALGALLRAITNRSLLKRPTTLGQLFSFYEDSLAASLPLNDIASIVKALVMNSVTNVTVESQAFSVQSSTNPGVLIHPDVKRTNNYWVYQISDQALFREEAGLALDTL